MVLSSKLPTGQLFNLKKERKKYFGAICWRELSAAVWSTWHWPRTICKVFYVDKDKTVGLETMAANYICDTLESRTE